MTLIFWTIVGLYLWYAYLEYRHERYMKKIQNANNLVMETIK